jgi:pimeloyl-ACP methyl ester carboxylesterase
MHTPKRFKSVNEYIETNGLRKNFVARRWGLAPWQLTALIYPDRYRAIVLDDEQIAKIAADLNQPESFVRRFARAA